MDARMTAADAPVNTVLILFLNRRTHGRILGTFEVNSFGDGQVPRKKKTFSIS